MMPRCRLKPVRNPEEMGTWCGPGAISILTGNRVEYICKKIAKFRNNGKAKGYWTAKRIKGMGNFEMRYILDHMGYQMVKLLDVKGITLGRWIDTYCTKHHRAICLVNVTDHYVVTHLGQVADNRTPKGCPLAEHPSRRCKIDHVWIIQRRRKS